MVIKKINVLTFASNSYLFGLSVCILLVFITIYMLSIISNEQNGILFFNWTKEKGNKKSWQDRKYNKKYWKCGEGTKIGREHFNRIETSKSASHITNIITLYVLKIFKYHLGT